MYSSLLIATYFLWKDEETTIDSLKLNKLVYFAHGWSLGLYNKPLISESIEAWLHGLIIPKLYHEFKPYGRGRIPYDKYTYLDLNYLDDDAKSLLDRIWYAYGDKKSLELCRLANKEGTPWHIIQNRGVNKYTSSLIPNIPNLLIGEYYEERVMENL